MYICMCVCVCVCVCGGGGGERGEEEGGSEIHNYKQKYQANLPWPKSVHPRFLHRHSAGLMGRENTMHFTDLFHHWSLCPMSDGTHQVAVLWLGLPGPVQC